MVKRYWEGLPKRAIVIGASSGIGLAVARLLLRDGWKVGVAARRKAPLEALKKEWEEQVEWAVIDVTMQQSSHLLRTLITALGGVDLFFYASGIGEQSPILLPEIELPTVQTNALGFTRMVGEAFRYFLEQGKGHIAVVSSIAGVRGLGASPSYSASKAFQNVYLEALEQKARNSKKSILITDIRPGFVSTPLLKGNSYPHLLPVDKAAKDILKAIYKRKHVAYIDGFWHVVALAMRCVPRVLWRRLSLGRHGAEKGEEN